VTDASRLYRDRDEVNTMGTGVPVSRKKVSWDATRRLFRRLDVADPRLVELRAWSRLAEELLEERVRLEHFQTDWKPA
jgi:hypothetical protein